MATAPSLILLMNLGARFARTDRLQLGIARQLQLAAAAQHIHIAFEGGRIRAIDPDELALARGVIAIRIVLCCDRAERVAPAHGVAAAGIAAGSDAGAP